MVINQAPLQKDYTFDEAYQKSLDFFKGDELATLIFVNQYEIKKNHKSKMEFKTKIKFKNMKVILLPIEFSGSTLNIVYQIKNYCNNLIIKQERKLLKKLAIEKFVKTKIKVYKEELNNSIEFTTSGIDEAINQPHKFSFFKNREIINIDNLIKKSVYVGKSDDIKDNPMIKSYHYFEVEICNESSYIVIREMKNRTYIFYSIVDNRRKKHDEK